MQQRLACPSRATPPRSATPRPTMHRQPTGTPQTGTHGSRGKCHRREALSSPNKRRRTSHTPVWRPLSSSSESEDTESRSTPPPEESGDSRNVDSTMRPLAPPLGCPLIIYLRNIIISPRIICVYVRIQSYTRVLVYVYLCTCMHPYILMPAGVCVCTHIYACTRVFQEYEEPVYSYSTYPDRRFSLRYPNILKMSPPFASSEGVSASGDRYQSNGV